MGSEPSPSADAGAPAFGEALARRVRPRQRTGRLAGGAATGSVVRRATTFGRVLGMSSMRRWAFEGTDGAGVDHLSVRPPVDYWPWADDDGDHGGDERVAAATAVGGARLGALARMVQGRRPVRRAGVVRRGLPIAAKRGGVTAAGPGTSPGAIAVGLRATLDSTPPSDAPRTPARTRAAARSASRPAAAAAPAGAARAARDVARRPVTRSPADVSAGPPPPALPPDIQALRDRVAAAGLLPTAPSGRDPSPTDNRARSVPPATPTGREPSPTDNRAR
ncbi:MAG: hypothetical protein ABW195_04835, partial [Ilumatobacteraceae bacterium]